MAEIRPRVVGEAGMGDRCRCGAELLPHLHFCVGCGADRQGPATGPSPVTAPPVTAPPVTAPRREPVPAWQAGGPPTWQAPAPSPLPHGPYPEWPHPQQAWAPAPRAPRPAPAPWLVALSIMLVLLISASAVLVTLRPELVGLASADPVVAPAAAAPAVTAPSASGPVSAAPAASPSEELAAQVDRDRTRAAALEGSWVPQLSSKKPGTVDSGITYDAAAILGHYRGLAQQYPNTLLLWSGDWPVFKGTDYWVVVVAQPFSTPAQANAWCDAQGFGRDDCLAKRLSHSGGPAGTTVPR